MTLLPPPSQLACYTALTAAESQVRGRARYGVKAFADALLVIPKTLGERAGLIGKASLSGGGA